MQRNTISEYPVGRRGGKRGTLLPYWRDSDVLDLANVFYHPNVTYSQYETYTDELDEAPSLKLLLQGDSFALGLRKDLLESDPNAEVWLVTNDYSVTDRNDQVTLLNYDWENLDWQYYLDNTDAVVVEIAEPFLKHRSYGFVQNLLDVLDSYTPEKGR